MAATRPRSSWSLQKRMVSDFETSPLIPSQVMSMESAVMPLSLGLRYAIHCCKSPFLMRPVLMCRMTCVVVPVGLGTGVGAGLGSTDAITGMGTSPIAS
eukprot:8813950-Pyramimonas_sp.AAC.1